MKKSTILLVLVILSNLVLFIGIQWSLFKILSRQLPIIGPLYNTLSSYIVDIILDFFIIMLLLLFNGLLAIFISMQLKKLTINTLFLSRIYFVSSIVINALFFIAVLSRILIAPSAGITTPTYAFILLTLFIIPFFSIVLLFWGLWLWFWFKIRFRPVLAGVLLSVIAVFIILAFLGTTFYKELTASKCNLETGEFCIKANPL